MRLKNILTLTITVILSFGLVLGTHAIFNPIKQAKERAIVLSKLETLFTDAKDFELNSKETIDGVDILLSARVLANDDEPLGYVYQANAINGFGNIKITLSVGLDEKIIDILFDEINQTMYVAQTMALRESYIYQQLSSNIPDANAGATSISMHTLMDMIRAIGIHHDGVLKFENAPLPYEAFFGNAYTIIDTTTENILGAVVKTEIISDELGTVYSITKAGIYNSESITEREITLVIALNNSGEIIGVLLPRDDYKHTMGGYYNRTLIFAETFVGQNLAELVDAYTGSTEDANEPNNSKFLVHELFMIAQGVYLP